MADYSCNDLISHSEEEDNLSISTGVTLTSVLGATDPVDARTCIHQAFMYTYSRLDANKLDFIFNIF